jgi:hypothetical protein
MCTIQHAHKVGLLHRDIKPATILLRHKLTHTSTIHDVDVVLADWALSIAIGDTQGKGGIVGTPRFLPPEVLSREQPFDTTCDVWAAGCVLAQMLRRDGGSVARLYRTGSNSSRRGWLQRYRAATSTSCCTPSYRRQGVSGRARQRSCRCCMHIRPDRQRESDVCVNQTMCREQ